MSILRKRLRAAALRLDQLALRCAPMLQEAIQKEATSVRTAFNMLEGSTCEKCNGKGKQGHLDCPYCEGSGEL